MERLSGKAALQGMSNAVRMRDIEGKEVVVRGVTFHTGKFGEFAIMVVLLPEGHVEAVLTSGVYVLDALHNADLDDSFPMQAKFTKTEKGWRIE